MLFLAKDQTKSRVWIIKKSLLINKQFFLHSRYFFMQKHEKKIKKFMWYMWCHLGELWELSYFKSLISPSLYQAIPQWLYFSKTRMSGLSFDIGLIASFFFCLEQKLNWRLGSFSSHGKISHNWEHYGKYGLEDI